MEVWKDLESLEKFRKKLYFLVLEMKKLGFELVRFEIVSQYVIGMF